jgi:hypothetical protein
VIAVPELDLYAVRITEIERLSDSCNVPNRGASHTLAVEIGRPSEEGIVRGHAESEMIKSSANWVERLASVGGVLVEVDAHGVVEPNHGSSEAEFVNKVGRKDDDASQDGAIKVETSSQVGHGDSIVVELGPRRWSRTVIH